MQIIVFSNVKSWTLIEAFPHLR